MNRQTDICPNCFYRPYHGGVCPRCSYTATEPDSYALPPGKTLGRKYILGRLLGVGGFGLTYLCLDTASGRVRAIKEYFPQAMADRGADGTMRYGARGDKRVFDYALRSFKEEADYLRQFSGEQGIVQVYDFFSELGTAYLVMEYLDGVTLKALLRRLSGKLSIPYANALLVSMIETLARVHARGLLHRDISPENIFLTKTGTKKIIDFGAAIPMTDTRDQDRDRAILLKPGFAPIEQYSSNGDQGPWTDVYALAATYYYVVTGVKPLDAKQRQRGIKMESIASLLPDASRAISDAIEKAMRPDPRSRYSSMEEFYAALPHDIHKTGRRSSTNMTEYTGSMSGTPYIMLEHAQGRGEKWLIPQNADIRIGRQPGINNVVIFDNSISREHGLIRYDAQAGGFVLRDISTNGIFSDKGMRYQRNRDVMLSPGSRFYLARENIMMRVGLD